MLAAMFHSELYDNTQGEVLIVGFHFLQSVLVTIDRHEWYAPPQLYTRNDSSGLWDVKPAIEPASVSPSIGNSGLPISQDISLCHHDTEPMHDVHASGVTDTAAAMEASSGDGSQSDFGSEAKKQRVEDDSSDGIAANGSLYGSEHKSDDAMATGNTVLRDFEGATALSANASLAECAIEPALVMFEVHVPPSCSLDGVHSQHFFGTGIIIYHSSSMGLAVVDKNTVAISASDVMLSFAAFPVEIPGEVVFLHPVHNYALIAYNPSAMGSAGASVIRAAELLPGMLVQLSGKVPLGFQLYAGWMMGCIRLLIRCCLSFGSSIITCLDNTTE